nr:MAG TPA: hypothetical protein [Caudoviricetes sp.]
MRRYITQGELMTLPGYMPRISKICLALQSTYKRYSVLPR